MSDREMRKLARLIAEELATVLKPKDNLLTTEEAAKVLGVKPATLRRNKDRYPHVKAGYGSQGRLMFKREGLKV